MAADALPTWLIGLAAVLGAMVVAALATVLLRLQAESLVREGHYEVAGFVGTTIGIVYAVLLAFVVLAVWQQYEAAQAAVDTEVGHLIALYRDTTTFPQPERADAQAKLSTYTELVISDEWSQMAAGTNSPRALAALNDIFAIYEGLNPQAPWQVALYAESFHSLSEMSTERSQRILSSAEGLSNLFWLILIAMGLLVVAFPVLIYMEHGALHVALTASLAGTI